MRVVRTLAAAQGRAPTASEQKNAERQNQRLFEEHGCSLDIPVESLEHEVLEGVSKTITTHHIRPQSWLRHLLAEDPDLLAGPDVKDPRPLFKAYWEQYQQTHPTHEVFTTHAGHLEQVVPLLMHGDEGRSQKKAPFLILSMESPIGSVPHQRPPCRCSAVLRKRRDLPEYGAPNMGLISQESLDACRSMTTNYKGHSYLSRFFLFGVGGWVFKKNGHVVEALFKLLVQDFTSLFHEGLEVCGSHFYGAVTGVKGDMDYHAKYYELTRWYSLVSSRSLGHICHSCLASTGIGALYSFEDFGERPQWLQSLHVDRPWSIARTPTLAKIPYDAAAPERALKGDPFHIVKLGIARDLVPGIVLLLSRKGFFDYEDMPRNLPQRLARAHSLFVMFCSASNLRPSLRSFTKENFHIKNYLSSPMMNCKGADSMILLKWLSWFLRLQLKQPQVQGYETILGTMRQTVEACQEMFQIMHSHKLFLERDCATRLYFACMRLVRGYRLLAKQAISVNVRAFVLKPKLHALHHVAHQLKTELEGGQILIQSPQSHACEINEDYIGRVARLSRRVNIRVCDLRIIERIFLKTRALIRKRRLPAD